MKDERPKHYALVLLIFFSAFVIASCGGSSAPAPSPTSSAAPPPSTGTGGGSTAGGGNTGGGTTGGGSGSTSTSQDFYLASMFSVAMTSAASNPQTTSTQSRGTIKVNESVSDGRGVLQITGADASSAYQLRFCMRGAPDDLTSCQTISDFSTDPSGAATVNFQMAPGMYSGAFFVFKNNEVRFAGGHNETLSGTSFSSALLPGAGTTGRGRCEVVGEISRFAISGGPASQEFRCMWLGLSAGSSGQAVLNTDSQGNGSTSLDLFMDHPPAARTGTFYCSAKCQSGPCEFTYSTGFKVQ